MWEQDADVRVNLGFASYDVSFYKIFMYYYEKYLKKYIDFHTNKDYTYSEFCRKRGALCIEK